MRFLGKLAGLGCLIVGPEPDDVAGLVEVVDERCNGERNRDEHDNPAHDPQPVGQRVAEVADHMRVLDGEQHDGDHLEHGLELSEHARRDDDALAGCHHAHARHDELAREDDEHDPGRKLVQVDERDEGRCDENLVCERVHELAEVGDLVAAAREVAVEPVGARDEHEDARGNEALPLPEHERAVAEPFGPGREQRCHEHGDEHDARDRYDVGRRPELLLRAVASGTHPITDPSIS